MSELVLNCEPLNNVLDGKEISKKDAYQVFNFSKDDPLELFKTAKILRNKNQGNIVSFSKKAFSLRPDDPKYAYTYAFYLHKSDKTDKAIEVLQGMVDRQIPYADAYILLGQIYEQKGKMKEAVEVYMKAAGNMKLSEFQRRSFSSRAMQIRIKK